MYDGKYHIMLNSGCRLGNLTWKNQDELESNTAMFSFHSEDLVLFPIRQHYSMSMTKTTKPVTAEKRRTEHLFLSQ